jgi:hypothetical protein
MKRECPPFNPDLIFFFQFFNTPGNEIAPGSDVIGKDFKNNRIRHVYLPFFKWLQDIIITKI